jgi:glucose-6-phosphate-specific signal transduction histidine kinase
MIVKLIIFTLIGMVPLLLGLFRKKFSFRKNWKRLTLYDSIVTIGAILIGFFNLPVIPTIVGLVWLILLLWVLFPDTVFFNKFFKRIF